VRKFLTATMPGVVDGGGGEVVCSLTAYCGSKCLLAREMDGLISRCSTIGSCQSAATSMIVKRVRSCCAVRRAI